MLCELNYLLQSCIHPQCGAVYCLNSSDISSKMSCLLLLGHSGPFTENALLGQQWCLLLNVPPAATGPLGFPSLNGW